MVLELDGTPFFWDGVRVETTRVSDETIRGALPMHSHAADSMELHVILAGGGQLAGIGKCESKRSERMPQNIRTIGIIWLACSL